jgi:hypothetical protein
MKSGKNAEFEEIAKVVDGKIGAGKPEDKEAKKREAEIAADAQKSEAEKARMQKE